MLHTEHSGRDGLSERYRCMSVKFPRGKKGQNINVFHTCHHCSANTHTNTKPSPASVVGIPLASPLLTLLHQPVSLRKKGLTHVACQGVNTPPASTKQIWVGGKSSARMMNGIDRTLYMFYTSVNLCSHPGHAPDISPPNL